MQQFSSYKELFVFSTEAVPAHSGCPHTSDVKQHCANVPYCMYVRVQKNPFFKNSTHWFSGFGAILGFLDLLFEQAVAKLVG